MKQKQPEAPHAPPAEGLAGLIQNWRNDLIAGLAVALVSMPLALGIALASDVPPMAGLLSAIIGGIVTTFVRGSHLAINGPAAGLIVVILAAVEGLRDESGVALPYVMAAIVVAGALQVLLGRLKLGTLGNFFPPSVIHGMLAAIGVIIAAKQIHVALGSHPRAHSAIGELLAIPVSLAQMNPYATIIALVSLAILILHPRLKSRLLHFFPAPLWVLAVSVPMALLFGFTRERTLSWLGSPVEVGPQFLIQLPGSLRDALIFPDFSRIGEPVFWLAVISICLVATIETLLSTKAVDRLDPYKRKTDLNKDLSGVGIATMLAGFLGGLPVITVIVRSSVNTNHGAATRWSNFYHGVILLGFLLLFPGFIQIVPLAALAAILVYTGYKLASPKVFKDTLLHGNEQFVILAVTLVATLYSGLLEGLMAGLLFTVMLHWIWSGMPPGAFLRGLVRPAIRVEIRPESQYVKVRGIANFITLFWLDRTLGKLSRQAPIVIDLAHARLVDLTTLEYLHELAETYSRQEGHLEILGLSLHAASSDHPHSLRRLRSHIQERKQVELDRRARKLQELAEDHNWSYMPGIDWSRSVLANFHFFETRPIEYRHNVLRGHYAEHSAEWAVKDVTFDEGALLATEEHHMTIMLLHLPRRIPTFTLEKEEFLDRLLDKAGYRDTDWVNLRDICSQFMVKGPDEGSIRKFFTEERVRFFQQHELYHLESNGYDLILFRHDRLASAGEVMKMVAYGNELVECLELEQRPSAGSIQEPERTAVSLPTAQAGAA